LDSRIKLKVGQIAIVNEFGATDFFDILFNDELGYAPNPLFPPGQPFSPAGKPGMILKFDLRDVTPGLYFKTAAYTAYVNAYRPDDNGFHYGDDFEHGVGYSAEVGYLEQKTDYAGVYKAGVNITDLLHYQDFTAFDPATNTYTGAPVRGDYSLYAIAEKSVYHPVENGKLNTAKGVDLLGEFTYAPGDRNLLEWEVDLGMRYTGPFECRPKDKVGAGFIMSQAGSHASNSFADDGFGHLQGEETFELDYQYHVADWLQIQPDVQYILDPRGNTNRDGILILALRSVVTF
jgi:porin